MKNVKSLCYVFVCDVSQFCNKKLNFIFFPSNFWIFLVYEMELKLIGIKLSAGGIKPVLKSGGGE